MRWLFAAIFLFLTVQSATAEDELVYTGSYWDTADSFRLTIDLSGSNVVMHWDGFSDGDPKRKTTPEKRYQETVKCTPDESEKLRRLVDRFELCHGGPMFAIGTGLSVCATRWTGGKEFYSYSYFSLNGWKYPGKRAEHLPLLLQSLIGDGDFSEENRFAFFAEVDAFGKFLADYRHGLDLLAECQEKQTPIPWKQVLAFLNNRLKVERSDLGLETWAAKEIGPVVSAVLSGPGLPSYFPNGVPDNIIVFLEHVYVTSDREGISTVVPPSPEMGNPEDGWVLLPPEVRGFLEEYIYDATRLGSGIRPTQIGHPYLLVFAYGDNAEQQAIRERMHFVDSGLAGYFHQLDPGDTSDAGVLSVVSMSFEKDNGRCVVQISGVDKSYTLLEKKHTRWEVLRLVDESDFLEYGFKEPLFK